MFHYKCGAFCSDCKYCVWGWKGFHIVMFERGYFFIIVTVINMICITKSDSISNVHPKLNNVRSAWLYLLFSTCKLWFYLYFLIKKAFELNKAIQAFLVGFQSTVIICIFVHTCQQDNLIVSLSLCLSTMISLPALYLSLVKKFIQNTSTMRQHIHVSLVHCYRHLFSSVFITLGISISKYPSQNILLTAVYAIIPKRFTNQPHLYNSYFK